MFNLKKDCDQTGLVVRGKRSSFMKTVLPQRAVDVLSGSSDIFPRVFQSQGESFLKNLVYRRKLGFNQRHMLPGHDTEEREAA